MNERTARDLGDRRPDPERRLLLRARRRLTVQVAGAFSVVLALVGLLVYCAMVHAQGTAARRDLAAIAERAPIAHPPPCVWLFELRPGGAVASSPGAPATLPVRGRLDRVAAAGEPVVEQVRVAGRDYLIRTQPRGGATVQVAMDLHAQAAERTRLLSTLVGAEIAGLLAALLVGQVVSRRAIAPLGEALARQRRFAADVSHELRTPLARLHLRAQLLARRLRGGTDPILLIDEVDQLAAGTRQLGEVVEDLLQSARFNQLRRPFGPVDLAVLAAELAAAESARAEARGVGIEVRTEGPGDPVVRGVESALRRVISALLDNALGHTGAGGHIWVTLANDPETVRLTVRDDGVGLDPADAERLFTRYVGSGFGLGLALVREVVEGHDGTITADGRPGEGATFTVRLPAALTSAPVGPAPPVPAREPDTPAGTASG
ncbi:sensor histidine kinase [Nonomuraea jiangxiensis]|uniref:Sensor-like histidine kinase SenX3 n=1 Tax=Nonomuraea jiangxiensis TaxID=633440 RepID=A0A1G9V2L3_9ACTN|nr:HAMP domain-containing sensor histidine kinase [Nonomuraea jiangxiensis]SDM66333.1 Signal transduction histidine kinase [Nonomuraea jiangxiensis]